MQYLSAAASLRLKYVCDRDSEMLNLEICMSGKSLLGFLKHTTNIWNYWYLVWAVRGAILHQIRIFFEHCSKGGGGSNPCSENMLQILYDLKGLLAT